MPFCLLHGSPGLNSFMACEIHHLFLNELVQGVHESKFLNLSIGDKMQFAHKTLGLSLTIISVSYCFARGNLELIAPVSIPSHVFSLLFVYLEKATVL